MKNTLRSKKEVAAVAVCVLIAFFFVISTIYGAVLNHTFVPHSDTWEGAINFYIESRNNSWAWWEQHFDHRILISKFIFWIDFTLFKGQAKIYVPLHLILLLMIALMYFSFYKNIIPRGQRSLEGSVLAVALSLIFSFSWMQRENIVWEFQSQFILVYLLPLTSFYLYAKGVAEGRSWPIGLSLVMAWLSAYTMANGVLVLPMLVVAGVFFKDDVRRVLLAAGLSVISVFIFFVGYEETPGRSFGYSMILNEPLKVILYALVYLGNPIFWVTKSVYVAALAALSFIVYLGYLLVVSLRQRLNPFFLALLVYAAYICMTAGLTAFGRSLFPVELAASSRYTTPGLTFWMVAILVLLSRNLKTARSHLLQLYTVFILCALFFFRAQVPALYYAEPARWLPYTKEVTALALQLGIDDQNAKRSLYPISENRDEFFQRAKLERLSIFSDELMYPAKLVGTVMPSGWDVCEVRLRRQDVVDVPRGAYRVKGNLVGAGKNYQHVIFTDEADKVVGVALAGAPKLGDVTMLIPSLSWILSPNSYDLFDGYIFGANIVRAYCQ